MDDVTRYIRYIHTLGFSHCCINPFLFQTKQNKLLQIVDIPCLDYESKKCRHI